MPEKFPYPEKSWAEGRMRKTAEAIPDMTGWDPKYIKEYLEGKDKAFQKNEEVNKTLRDIERKYNQPAGKQKRGEVEGNQQMAKAALPRSGVGPSEVRELEGLRREKTQHLSQAEGQMQQMSPEDFNKYWKGNWSVTGKIHKINPNEVDSSGTIVEKDHPQIKELQGQGWESFSLPDEGWNKGHMLMRPPQNDPTPVGQGPAQTGVG